MIPASKRGPVSAIAILTALLGGFGVARAELPLCNGAATPNRLKIEIEGLRTTDGQLAITVYGDDPTRFLTRGGSLGVHRQPVEVPVSHACIALPGAGAYAVTVYQDVNHDGAFNRSLFGPTEPWGLSNDPPTILGLPSFKAVRFETHAGDNVLRIRMRFSKN
jgi:uncharacterized protein (DUF2141 family)